MYLMRRRGPPLAERQVALPTQRRVTHQRPPGRDSSRLSQRIGNPTALLRRKPRSGVGGSYSDGDDPVADVVVLVVRGCE